MVLHEYDEFPQLETKRLYLRQMTNADAEALTYHFGDERVLEFIDIEHPKKTVEANQTFIAWFNNLWTKKTGWRWGITLKDRRDFVMGTAGFHGWNQGTRIAEIGYDINPEYWGKGYASELLQGMIKFGFETMNLHRIEADVVEGNLGSVRVLEKNGFIHEGTWREREMVRGNYVNSLQFGLLASK